MTRLMDSDMCGERFILSAGDYSYAGIMEMIAVALGSPRSMKLLSPSALKLARATGCSLGTFYREAQTYLRAGPSSLQ